MRTWKQQPTNMDETNMHSVTDEAPVRGQVQDTQKWPQTVWVWPFTGRAWLLRVWARMCQRTQLDPSPPSPNPTRSFDFWAGRYRLFERGNKRTKRLFPGRHRTPPRGLPHRAQSARARHRVGRWDGTPEEGQCADQERSCSRGGFCSGWEGAR